MLSTFLSSISHLSGGPPSGSLSKLYLDFGNKSILDTVKGALFCAVHEKREGWGRKVGRRWRGGQLGCSFARSQLSPLYPSVLFSGIHFSTGTKKKTQNCISWSWARVLTLLPDQQSPDDAPKLRVGIRMVLQMSLVDSLACPPSASGLCRLNLKFILGSHPF